MLRIITPPTAEPVSLVEAKAHLSVDFTDDDSYITALIKAATLQAQARTQRLFVQQTVEWILPNWPDALRLPIAPVRAADGIVSIKYVDPSDVQQTWAAANYVVRQDGPTACIFPLWGNVWPYLSLKPAAEPIVIRFTAGQLLDASPPLDIVPENVKTAIKLLIGDWYANREQTVIALSRAAVFELPNGVEALLQSELWD